MLSSQATPAMNASNQESRPVQVLAVTGGKGGVGKTSVSINLSIALAELGRRPVLLDADLGLANVDVLLGLSPKRNLADVLSGECGLQDIMLDGPGGIRIIPASSGTQSMVSLDNLQHAGLIHAFSDIASVMDTLVIDTAAGISESVVSFVRAAQQCLVVVCDEPSSITDAYALIKLLNRDHGMDRFHIVPNQVRSPQEGRNLYIKLAQVCDRFLDLTLYHDGDIPHDDMVRKCIQRQKPVMIGAPRSRAAIAFRELAAKVQRWPLPNQPSGHLQFFVEQLLSGHG